MSGSPGAGDTPDTPVVTPDTPDDTHTEHEDRPWTIQIPDHPKRKDSATYVASRKAMNQMAAEVNGLLYGQAPYQDHHGGGLWLKDADGWFLVRNLAGIEWSAQFCADPAKVDQLRLNARRLYAAFPDAVDALGIRELLDTPITDAEGIARWTDSICNASVPYPAAFHTGVLPGHGTGGVHHYPLPIAEIQLFKRDDFTLWVDTADGGLAAVVPVAPRFSGDGRTRLLFAAAPVAAGDETPIDRLFEPPPTAIPAGPDDGPLRAPRPGLPGPTARARPPEDPTILPADHPLSRKAFALQE
jgi:hypothetical protein